VVFLYGEGERPAGDLTARARIVDAALAQFASRGTAATMRSIAEAAGVSVGLVQHHFGTKDGLREACDERVLALVRVKVANAGPGGRLTDPDFLWSLRNAAVPVMPYVARVALEVDDRAAVLFDEVAALTATWLTGQWPERFPVGVDRTKGAAAVLLAMSMSTIVMHHHLVRLLDLGADEPIPSPRVGIATLDVYQAIGDLLDSPLGAQFREAVDTFSEHEATGGSES
jgi:AcrR family transcriptional regulator